MCRNLQIDVNIHYFPSTFLSSLEEKKAIQQDNPFKIILIQRMQTFINQKRGSSDPLGVMGENITE